MLTKLKKFYDELAQVEAEMMKPEIVSNQAKYQPLVRKRIELQPRAKVYQALKRCEDTIREAIPMLEEAKDSETRAFVQDELDQAEARKERILQEARVALLPVDPNDAKNCIVEIRAGAGGDEAALFAEELSRMYLRFIEGKGFKSELIDRSDNTGGGGREVIFKVAGPGADGVMKEESGVHRVQRIPVTESQGRVHTSMATVAMLPEAGRSEEHT